MFYFLRRAGMVIIPDCLKIAKVTPIHKAEDKQDTNNYIPISLLPTPTKIFGKAIILRREFFFSETYYINESLR